MGPGFAIAQRKADAQQLHAEICANGEVAAVALVEFCKGLKRMRDEKLYTELGYDNFNDYAEKAVGIGQSQAYTYIQGLESLGEAVLQSTAKYGITKIKLLTQIPAIDREEFIAENDVENMSTREMAELVKKLTAVEEQLSFAQLEAEQAHELATDTENKLKEAEEALQKARAEAKEYKDRPQPVAVSQADPDEVKNQVQKEVDKAEKRLKAEHQKALERAVEQAKESADRKLQSMEKAASEAAQRAAELEKKLKVSGNDKTIRFSLLFEATQNNFNQMMALIEGMKADGDDTTAEKFKAATAALLNNMLANATTEEEQP